MPRRKGDVLEEISDIKNYVSYDGKKCIVCDKKIDDNKKTVIDIYNL